MKVHDLNDEVAIRSPFKLRPVFEPMEIKTLLLHLAVPKLASRFTTFDLARVKTACTSWNLAYLTILNTFVFSFLSSPIWKGKSPSTDGVKE